MMDSFVKIFSDYGSGGIERLENDINEFARKRSLDIVSASPCFRKGFIDADGMHIVVVFKKKYIGKDTNVTTKESEKDNGI